MGHLEGGLAHGLLDPEGQPGSGGLLDQLLVAALGRAVPRAEVDAVAVVVAQDLDLDVAGLGQVTLDVALVPGEVGQGFPLGRLEGVGSLVGAVDDLHAPSAAAEGGLDGDRPTVLGAEGDHLVGVGEEVGVAGDAGNTDVGRGGPGADLVTHDLDGRRGRSDEGDAPLGDGPSEVCVLAEEAVAGMDGVGPRAFDGIQDGVGVEVALGRRLPAEGEGLIGQSDMQGVTVELGVDGDGADPQLLAGPYDPDGDLTTVRYQDVSEHPPTVCTDDRVRRTTPTTRNPLRPGPARGRDGFDQRRPLGQGRGR